MKNSPPNIYGFQYRFRGRNYATDLAAADPEEAIARIRAMAKSELRGAFVPIAKRVGEAKSSKPRKRA
jgi:hypothetical protein